MTAAMVVIVATACSTGSSTGTGQPAPASFDAARRSVRIETTGCGFASGRVGSGVAVGDGIVITVAHLVAQADDIVATIGNHDPVEAVVTAVDLNLDLAALRVSPHRTPAVEMSGARRGAEGLIIGGAASGTIPFEVEDAVNLSIEEVLGVDRHDRLGYKLAATTVTGDSGAGAYDLSNRLIGIVFATGSDGESTWATSSIEVERFLADHHSDVTPLLCDAETSRLDIP